MSCYNDTNEKIQSYIKSNLHEEAIALYYEFINELRNEKHELYSHTCFEFAIHLFNLSEYELSILMFEITYNLNYRCDDIEHFLYESFVIPNQQEFELAYWSQIKQASVIYADLPDYSQLPLDFIPYADNKYFIFDKSMKSFCGTIDVSEENLNNYFPVIISDEFYDLIITGNWNISDIHDYVKTASNRLIYYIVSEPLKALSLLKIPSIYEKYYKNVILVDSITSLQAYLHNNTAIYIPKLIYSKNNTPSDIIAKMIEEEHAYRLTKEGRNTSNILLTIGIPSYNRGHRALKSILHLIESRFDSEIEFVVSNNCSISNTDGYDEIEKMTDSRINYFKFTDNPGGHINFCQVVSIAKGKYVVMMSDEDTVILSSISHYMRKLKDNPNISYAIFASSNHYSTNTDMIHKRGDEAFLASFLVGNYVSGLVYKTELFHKLDIYPWVESRIYTNHAIEAYAHSCWGSYFTFFGDYYEGSVHFFKTGNAEESTHLTHITNSIKESKILDYATYENRIKQHDGFIELLNQFNSYLSKSSILDAYFKLCQKTYFLLYLVKHNYINNGIMWDHVCLQLKNCCLNGIGQLQVECSTEDNLLLEQAIENLHNMYL